MHFSNALASFMAVGSVVSSPVSIPRDVNTPLKLGQQNCFERFNHKDVSAEHQEDNIFRACQIAGTIGPKDYGVSIKHPIFLGPTYRYNIHWIPGCVTTVPEQEIWGPIPGDTSVTCPSLLSNDFLACNNGGAGGWIDAGCLRYTFSIKELPQGWE